jgi:hypothetical protein
MEVERRGGQIDRFVAGPLAGTERSSAFLRASDFQEPQSFALMRQPRVKFAHRAFHLNWVAIQIGDVYYLD